MIRFIYGGFSHSVGFYGVLEGIPFGVKIDEDEINKLLIERQEGIGRSDRQKSEKDRIKFLSGVIDGVSVGAPLVFCIENKMLDRLGFSVPRPNHADLNGAIKNGMTSLDAADGVRDIDFSIISEVSSARSSCIVVAAGAICIEVLKLLGIELEHRVLKIAGIDYEDKDSLTKFIEGLRLLGDTAGGSGEVVVRGLKAGIGGYALLGDKLDGKLAGAVMSVPSIKGIEIGRGSEFALLLGSECSDNILLEDGSFKRASNNCGGIEGGVSSGGDIVVRFFIKPPPSVVRGAKSIDFKTGEIADLNKLRTDVCAAESVACVAKAVVAIEILKQILSQFNSDNIDAFIRGYNNG